MLALREPREGFMEKKELRRGLDLNRQRAGGGKALGWRAITAKVGSR